MSKGLYFYKLVSPYKEDVTKNCKLTVNEIDSNFLTLKDEDIKSAELDEKTKSVILTRNNGDKLVVDLTPVLSGTVYDLKVVYENPSSGSCSGASVYVTYSILTDGDVKQTINVPITGLVTTDNIDTVLGGGLLTRVITDGTLTGNGTISSPLGISETEKNTPALRLIDKTIGEELPTDPTKGDKYVTKEQISDFGRLYNFTAVKAIQDRLDAEGKGWRVPEKSDWDCLLNSIEPCDYDENYLPHDDTACHVELGKYAGQKLKSKCGWTGEDDCECKNTSPLNGNYCGSAETETETDEFDVDDEQPKDEPEPKPITNCVGTDEYRMTILPTGYKDEFEIEPKYIKNMSAFWTNTHVCNNTSQDIYVKKFEWNRCGVVQEAQCPSDFYSIRLVKDYNGDNSFDSETIDGLNYKTLLFPACKQVWTASNFFSDLGSNSVFAGNTENYFKTVYYVNVWNGKFWEKKALVEGEAIVIIDGNPECQSNIEYRVYLESGENGCNNQILVNTDDAVVERVLHVVKPLIDQEREERIAADEELLEALNEEVSARTEADEILQQEIEDEVERAQEVESQLWDAINNEAQAREEVDQQLWDAIAQEASARTDVDNQLWDAIAQEYSARTEADTQLWEAIAEEASARTDVDNQLWAAIEEEARIREEIDNQQWAAIEEEARIREEIDNQQWDAINAEIARAKEEENRIECQIIDNPADPMNDATSTQTVDIDGTKYYVLRANGGLTLYSKCGTNDIPVRLDSNYGTF